MVTHNVNPNVLPRTTCANDGYLLSRGDSEVESVEDLLARNVTKRNVFKRHVGVSIARFQNERKGVWFVL